MSPNKNKTADGAEEGKGVRESSRTTEEGVREARERLLCKLIYYTLSQTLTIDVQRSLRLKAYNAHINEPF